jgi:hypothetical protein
MKALSLGIGENRSIKDGTRNGGVRFEGDGLWECFCFWKKGFRERIRDKRWSIRGQQGQGNFAIKCELFQINQKMPCGQAVSYDLPDGCFYQMGGPPRSKTALDLFDAGDLSSGPNLEASRQQSPQRQERADASHARTPDCSDEAS